MKEDTTRETLLIRIKNRDDSQAWSEFHELYAPLLYRFSRERGLSHDDAEDIRATCFAAIVKQVEEFEYDRSKGGFKAWLRTLVNRRIIDRARKRKERTADSRQLSKLASDEKEAHEIWDRNWQQQHLLYCFDLAKSKTPETTFRAFEMLIRERATVPEVCKELGLNANQVYKAKARVLQIVREELQLLDPDLDF